VKKGSKVIRSIFLHTKIPQKATPQKMNPFSYKDRRLILNEAIKIKEQIDSLKLRNLINKAFKEKKEIATFIITIILKSFIGTSIILITTEQFFAEFLT
jgi:hypothetical protein